MIDAFDGMVVPLHGRHFVTTAGLALALMPGPHLVGLPTMSCLLVGTLPLVAGIHDGGGALLQLLLPVCLKLERLPPDKITTTLALRVERLSGGGPLPIGALPSSLTLPLLSALDAGGGLLASPIVLPAAHALLAIDALPVERLARGDATLLRPLALVPLPLILNALDGRRGLLP